MMVTMALLAENIAINPSMEIEPLNEIILEIYSN
jgi:hypothetical protein